MYYCPPASLRGDKTLPYLPGAPASMLQKKHTKNQDKHDRKRTARKTNKTRALLTPPLRFLRAFRWSPPSTLSWCRFALASLGDARAAYALRLVVKHDAAITVEPPATSSRTDVAMRGLRRSVLLMAEFTVRTRHGAPLRCAELFGSAAARVPSSLCCVCPLFAFRVCVQCALLRGTAVPNLHYSGICLNSAGTPLFRALSASRDFTCTIPGTCTI